MTCRNSLISSPQLRQHTNPQAVETDHTLGHSSLGQARQRKEKKKRHEIAQKSREEKLRLQVLEGHIPASKT